MLESLIHYFEQRWVFDEQPAKVDQLQVDKRNRKGLQGNHHKLIGILEVSCRKATSHWLAGLYDFGCTLDEVLNVEISTEL